MADLLVFQSPVTGTGSLVFTTSASGPGSAPDVRLSCAGILSDLSGGSSITASLPSGQLSVAGTISELNGSGHLTASLPPAKVTASGPVSELSGNALVTMTRPEFLFTAVGLLGELGGSVELTARSGKATLSAAGTVGELDGQALFTATLPSVDLLIASLVAELDGAASITAKRPEFRIFGTGLLGELDGGSALAYDSQTQRPHGGVSLVSWQSAKNLQMGSSARYRAAISTPQAVTAVWQGGLTTPAGQASGWQDASRLQAQEHSRYKDAQHLKHGISSQYDESVRVANSADTFFRDGIRFGQFGQSRFQETYRDRVNDRTTRFANAKTLTLGLSSQARSGQRIFAGHKSPYEAAIPPSAGLWLRPTPRTPGHYTPSTGLLFSDPWSSDTALVFISDRHASGEPVSVVVPLLRTYVTVNSITLRRVDGDIPIPAYGFAMGLDWQSWTWSWSASIALASLPIIKPGDGQPIEIEAVINSVPYRLVCEGVSSQHEFAKRRVQVKGRGLAAVLDAPYAPVLNFASADARSAQQLMQGALTINGVSIGWELDWGLTDWLVPGNTWTHQGAYISAITAIAQAAGGYVQPHNTAKTLRILPSYPTAPWAWADVTPGVELPSAVVTVEGIDWTRKPDYNRVFVSGMSNGVLGQVTRAGTAGDSVAPMITDALITHADAARQRGLSVLSDTGAQERINLTLPVLAETGLITPGQFVRYVDSGSTTRMGLVRSTNLTWALPKMRQTLSIETHV